MIDLHCHLLPGLDDGAPDLDVSLAMARAFVADGVSVVACTPHILPGLYHNEGSQIRAATAALQEKLREAGIALSLVHGADVHIDANILSGLRAGRLLSIAGSRYVLLEPPHNVLPLRLDELFFNVLVGGYVPVLTHPERLTWINQNYAIVQKMARGGVWMQITAGSLTGAFGRNAKYWAERMLDEGLVHFIATDAHDTHRRPPILARGRDAAAARVGDAEAEHLVFTRPAGILRNEPPGNLPLPSLAGVGSGSYEDQEDGSGRGGRNGDRGGSGIAGRLRRLFQ